MNINKLKLLISAVIYIADTHADIETNLQNTISQQSIDEENLSAIEPTQTQNENVNNLFSSNSDASLDSVLDALEQNHNNVVNTTVNEQIINNDISALNNGFIQFDAETSNASQYYQQQSFNADVCHELALNFSPGHTYNETKGSSSADSSGQHPN